MERPEIKIINNLLLAIDLASDGGPAAFWPEEEDAMREFLMNLLHTYELADETNKK